jgi:uncharacterized membrane protein YjjP (DUF1212 family)
MSINRAAHIAMEAGKIILENGGETYRVEETITRILNAFGYENTDSFVTPTGIMMSASDEFGNTVSLVKRIRKRTVNLEKIASVNDLSRSISVNKPSLDYILKQLKDINSLPRYSKPVTLLFAALAAGSFSVLFGGDMLDFVSAFVIGGIIKYVTISLGDLRINEFFVNIIGGAIAASLTLTALHFNIPHNMDKVIIGSIMLLVPGLSITNAIRDTIAGDLVAGTARAVEAFLVAIGIAVGAGLALKIWISLGGGML